MALIKCPECERENVSDSAVKCPNCGSMNTKRISTSSRVASVAMTGIASSKIGKQYRCIHCKYKW